MMSIRDLEYLKGFTLLPVKDPLAEAWTVLKNPMLEGVARKPVSIAEEVGPQAVDTPCANCNGQGVVPSPGVGIGQPGIQNCPSCDGHGVTSTFTPSDPPHTGLGGDIMMSDEGNQ